MPYVHYNSSSGITKPLLVKHSRAVRDVVMSPSPKEEDPFTTITAEHTKVIMGFTAEALPFQIMVCFEKSQNPDEIYPFVDEWLTPLIDQYCEKLRAPKADLITINSEFLDKINALKDKYGPPCHYSMAFIVTHTMDGSYPVGVRYSSGFVLGEMAIAMKAECGYKEQLVDNERVNRIFHKKQQAHDEIVAYSHSNKKITDHNCQEYEHFGRSTSEQERNFRKCDDGTFIEVSLIEELVDIHQPGLKRLHAPVSYSQMIVPDSHEREIIALKKYQAELAELITLIPLIEDPEIKKKVIGIKKILRKAIDVNLHTDFYYNKVLSDTLDLLKCRTEIRGDKLAAYKKQAERLTGHKSNGLKKLGFGMLALAAVLGIVLGVCLAVSTFGIGSVPGVVLITAGSAALLTSIGAFATGRQKGLSKATRLLTGSIDRVGNIPILSK